MANEKVNKVVYDGSTLIDITDTTATASDVAQGKYFYLASGEKVAGTSSGGGGTEAGTVTQDQDGYLVLDDDAPSGRITVEALSVTQNGTYTAPTGKAYSPVTVSVSGGGAVKLGVLRPDAELVQSWSYDKYIVADEGVTLPSYSATGIILKTGSELSISGTLDFDSYHYAVVYRGLTMPEYSTQDIGKGREEYFMNFQYYEPYNVVAGVTGQTVSTTISTVSLFMYGTGSYAGWYSASSFRNTATPYGFHQSPYDVSYSGNTLTIKSPDLKVTGNTNYFSQTYWDATDDVRFQYIIELYRVPKTGSNVNGFVQTSVANHIVSCANSASGTLT